MISTDEYDAVITCHGCENKCIAGFKKDIPIGPKRTIPAKVKLYMTELKKCSKLQ